jgi:hypothetical protein
LQPQNIETFYAFQNEVKVAKFKSFDRLPKIFGFSACILIAFLGWKGLIALSATK